MTKENHTPNTLPDIRQTVVLNAPIKKVWDAVATSKGIEAWFMPNDFQPTVGHEFHLNAGPFGMSPCKVTQIDPPNMLSFRWGKDWTIIFELKAVDGKTEFTLIHAGWDPDKMTEFNEPHTVVRDRMNQGWGGLKNSLAAYVES